MNDRNSTIDFLRAWGVILMIFIHATAYYSKNSVAHTLWDYTHFAVPLFVFCSFFLSVSQYNKSFRITYKTVLKRLKRLLIPYYLFLFTWVVFSPLLLSKFFTFRSFVDKIFFFSWNSRDVEWLVFLFVVFIFVVPVFGYLSRKSKKAYVLLLLIIGAIPVYFLFGKTSIPIRFAMIPIWMLFYPIAQYFYTHQRAYKNIFLLGMASLVVFLVSGVSLNLLGKSLVFTANKYPPNIYYLSYGCVWISFGYLLYEFLPKITLLEKVWYFFSSRSYSLYLIHFLILLLFVHYRLYSMLPWWILFILLMGSSICIQLLLDRVKSMAIFAQH